MESGTEFRGTSNASRASPGDGGAIESVNRTGTSNSIDSTGSNGTRLTAQALKERAAANQTARLIQRQEADANMLKAARKDKEWEVIRTRYVNANTTDYTALSKPTPAVLGIFSEQLTYAPYMWGRHGIPLPGILAHPAARITMPLIAIAVPSIPLLAHSIEPDSCAAAMYFSGFNLLLWITAGVWQGVIGHGVCAGIATALFINGYNNAQKSFGNDESALDTWQSITAASVGVGVVTSVVMGLLQEFVPAASVTQQSFIFDAAGNSTTAIHRSTITSNRGVVWL